MKINQVWVTEHHIGGTTGRSTGRHLFKLREGHRALPAPVKTCLVPGTSTYLKHFETTNLGMYLLGSMINGFNGFSQGDQQTMIVCKKTRKAARRFSNGNGKYGKSFVPGRMRLGSGLVFLSICAEYLCWKKNRLGPIFIHTSHESWPTIDIHIVEEIVEYHRISVVESQWISEIIETPSGYLCHGIIYKYIYIHWLSPDKKMPCRLWLRSYDLLATLQLVQRPVASGIRLSNCCI